MPTTRHEPRRGGFDGGLRRERNVVERRFGRLKERRRIATRHGRLAPHRLGMAELATVRRIL